MQVYSIVPDDALRYSMNDVLTVFKYYFEVYEEVLGQTHPPIRFEQIRKIIDLMPFLGGDGFEDYFIEPDTYEYLIDRHFVTKYRSCDYNINHFFSGNIRLLRYYETCY